MKKYKHIFFDLDQTLWDFEKSSAETIKELFNLHSMEDDCSFTCEAFVQKFYEINDKLWAAFSTGKISKEQLRNSRFRIIFNELKYSREDLIEIFAEQYLLLCPQKSYLVPYAKDILDYLSDKYELYIITNGFEEVQRIKLKSSGILEYFKAVITSESVGYRKPEKEIFNYALEKASCNRSSCIMIGDNLEADILGASNSSIDNIFYNPKKISYHMYVTHEIRCLSELRGIL